MKRTLLLSIAFITLANTITPAHAELNIRIPTALQVGAYLTAGTLSGVFSLLTTRFAYFTAQEDIPASGRPEKLFHRIVTLGSGMAAITSGIVSYLAFKNAYQLLK